MRTYLAVAVISGLAAWLLYSTYLGDRASTSNGSDVSNSSNETHVVTGLRDPLWYRAVSDEEARLAARRRLDLMTSTEIPPTETGPLKDEVALLCLREDIVDIVVESYRSRKDVSPAQVSAYMEIFARVRHEKFALLVADGVADRQAETRLNAVQAATVQRDPRLAPFLNSILPDVGSYDASRIITALAAMGSAEAYEGIRRAVADDDPVTALAALRVVSDGGAFVALPDVRARLDDDDPTIRVIAAWTLIRLGQRSLGTARLLRAAKNRDLEGAARAQALQLLHEARDDDAASLVADVRPLTESDDVAVALEAFNYLVTVGDEAANEKLAQDLDAKGRPRELLRALTVCGRSGRDVEIERVMSRRSRYSAAEMRRFVESLQNGQAPGAVACLVELAATDDAVGQAALRAFVAFGERALDALAELLKTASGRDRILAVVAPIQAIASPRSIDLIEAVEAGSDRRLRRLLRENIRLVEQKLLARLGPRALAER